MAQVADAAVLVHGILVSIEDRDPYEGKPRGPRVTIAGARGGVAVVNFKPEQAVPFAPLLSQVVWFVKSSPWAMDSGSGMSTTFVAEVTQNDIADLEAVILENEARFPDLANA